MQFIPIAEETGLIEPIDEWVLRRAACRPWRSAASSAGPSGVANQPLGGNSGARICWFRSAASSGRNRFASGEQPELRTDRRPAHGRPGWGGRYHARPAGDGGGSPSTISAPAIRPRLPEKLPHRRLKIDWPLSATCRTTWATSHRPHRDRPRRQSRHGGSGRGRRNRGAAGFPRRFRLRRPAGYLTGRPMPGRQIRTPSGRGPAVDPEPRRPALPRAGCT